MITLPPRTPEDVELATQVYLQLHKLSLESLLNLKASVAAEIRRKTDQINREWEAKL